MADSNSAHGQDDPKAAPMHHEIQEQFSSGAVLFCFLLAAAALLGGIIGGLTLVVD